MEPQKSGTISAGGMDFRYRDHGSGEPVLWLGATGTSRKLKDLVAARHRLIELEPSGPPTTAEQHAQAIAEAMAFLGLDRAAFLAEGLQAAAALALALDQPTLMPSLLLLAPTVIDTRGQAANEAEKALIARLDTLRKPVLALFGTRDTLAPPEAARHYRERIASSSIVFVYDAGPNLGADRPEAVAELVTDFIARSERFLVRQTDDRLYP